MSERIGRARQEQTDKLERETAGFVRYSRWPITRGVRQRPLAKLYVPIILSKTPVQIRKPIIAFLTECRVGTSQIRIKREYVHSEHTHTHRNRHTERETRISMDWLVAFYCINRPGLGYTEFSDSEQSARPICKCIHKVIQLYSHHGI